MSTEILEFLKLFLEISPTIMVFLIAFASIIVVGMALFLVLVMKSK